MTNNARELRTSQKLYFEDIQVGDEIPLLVKAPITHLQLVRYAGGIRRFSILYILIPE